MMRMPEMSQDFMRGDAYRTQYVEEYKSDSATALTKREGKKLYEYLCEHGTAKTYRLHEVIECKFTVGFKDYMGRAYGMWEESGEIGLLDEVRKWPKKPE